MIMELEKLAEKLKDLIVGEVRDELKAFRAAVTGELAGFRIALESINARQASFDQSLSELRGEIARIHVRLDNLNKRLDDTNMRIDDVNKRFDDVNKRFDDVNKRLDDTNMRIDDVNKRFDDVYKRFDDVYKRFDEVDKRFDDVNKRFDDVNRRIDEVHKRIDDVIADNARRMDALKVEFKTELAANTRKIEEMNGLWQAVLMQLADMQANLKAAVAQKEIIDDVLVRLRRLESQSPAATGP